MSIKYSFALILSIFLTTLIFGQKKQILYYNADGYGVADSGRANYYRIASIDSTGKSIDSVYDYFTSGQLRLKGIAIKVDRDDDRNTTWVGRRLIYYKNGQLFASDFFNKNGKTDSICVRYYESGKMKQLINFKNGTVVDKFYKEWDELGRCEKVFTDLFKYDNNKNGWPLNVTDDHEAKIIKDSGLEMTSFSDKGFMQALYLPVDPHKNYSIETQVRLESGSNNLWHGLIWGFQNANNYFFYYINGDGHFKVGYVTDGIVSYAAEDKENSAINPGKGVQNLLKIIRQKQTIYFCANGHVLYQAKAYLFTGNRIGFFVNGKQQDIFQRMIVRQSIDDTTYTTYDASAGNSSISESKDWKWSGAGFFIDTSGYIVTNYHNIVHATDIEIGVIQDANRNFFKAKLVSSDKQNDLALLKITDEKFTPYFRLPYSLKAGICDVASYVFTLSFSVASASAEVKFRDGKISSATGINDSPEEYLTSISMQPGNTGGPLFDSDGNIIGIMDAQTNNGIFYSPYAIKSTYFKNFLDAFPGKISLPDDTSIASKQLTEKVKILTNYVVVIRVR